MKKKLVTRRAALLAAPLILAPELSRAAPPGWPTSLVIGTGSPGGTYVVYGGGVAKILTEALGIPVTTQATQGPDQNVVLLEAGQIQLGLVSMGPALQGWNGMGAWTRGKKYRAMRAIFPMYDSPFWLLTLKGSNIHSVSGMADKLIGVGPPGGTGGTYFPSVFKALNIPVQIRNGAYVEMGSQLKLHQLDVATRTTGSLQPFLTEIGKQEEPELVGFGAEEIAILLKAMPELSATVVPAGTYESLKVDYKTVGMYNFTVASSNLPDDLVYAIVKAVFENRERLIAIETSAKDTLAANVAKNSFLPFHPGAVRYYREIGIKIPDNLTKAE